MESTTSKPVDFMEYLTRSGLTDNIYKAMYNPDLSEIVNEAMILMKGINHFPLLPHIPTSFNIFAKAKELKTEGSSTSFRTDGNKAYCDKNFQKALICYNKALAHAPKNSRAMKLAYSNRSALFYKMQFFAACIKDIDTCFAMGCPGDITEKLKKRKEDALSFMWTENLNEQMRRTSFYETHFTIKQQNPQIPCASKDVGVIVEDHVPKIVAATDVKVGAVLAVETAFASLNDFKNREFSCHYCHAIHLNLLPCDTCCIALFCSENCKVACMSEYHAIECQIMEIIETSGFDARSQLAIQTIFKMRNLCEDWSELIAASELTGIQRIKNSSINQIYNPNNKFSILCNQDTRHFLNGRMYNASFTSAFIVTMMMEKLQTFFPKPQKERIEAMNAVARLLMYFILYCNETQPSVAVTVRKQKITHLHKNPNYGWFSFIGKLKHSCNPNALLVGLNKKACLIALKPIKRGTEITISYIGHWLDNSYDMETRRRILFLVSGTICKCPICTNDITNRHKLTDVQLKNFRKLKIDELTSQLSPISMQDTYEKLCKMLTYLSDLTYSNEYKQAFDLFRRIVFHYQDFITNNILIDYADETHVPT